MTTGDLEQETSLIPGIPNDIVMACVAKVPLRDLGSLRLVSKAWLDVFSNGEIYEERKYQGLLQKFLIIFVMNLNKTGISCLTELHAIMYDLESQTWWNVRPLHVFEGKGTASHFNAISSGSDLFLAGNVYSSPSALKSDTVRILRGAYGRWETHRIEAGGVWPHCLAHVSDGELFLGHAQPYSWIDGGVRPYKLVVSKYDGQGTWTDVKVLYPPLQSAFDNLECCVTNNKVHLLDASYGSHKTHLIFDPKSKAWEVGQLNPNGHIGMMSGQPFTTTHHGTLFGVFRNDTEGYGTAIMRYDEPSKEWDLVATLPNQVYIVYLESIGDELFLIESVSGKGDFCDVSLSVLKVSYGDKGVSGEWKVKNRGFNANFQKLLCCSALEL